jgi:hypothetical protein
MLGKVLTDAQVEALRVEKNGSGKAPSGRTARSKQARPSFEASLGPTPQLFATLG